MGKEEADLNSLNTLLDKKYEIKAKAAKALLSAYVDLKKVLSKDQMNKLRDIWGKVRLEDGKCPMMG